MRRFIGYQLLKGTILALLSLPAQASFIEQTMGAAVVNDATAAYFNPAALTVLPNLQIIGLGTLGKTRFQFTGRAQQGIGGHTESGTSSTATDFILPSFYLGLPVNDRVTAGLAVVGNEFNRGIDDHSILRYVQPGNQIDDVDWIPAVGVKINEFVSLGANLNFSSAHFVLQPISGLTSLQIPDSKSRNESRGTSFGGDAGILVTPSRQTRIGFNYRSAMTYDFSGQSRFNGSPGIRADDYHFNYWTPARSVFSVSHFVTQTLGFIGTLQYVQWDIFKKVTVYNIATQVGPRALIVPKAQVPYNFHDTWLLTLGTIYKLSPQWTARVAATYNQSPADGNFQIDTGDSYILGASVAYQVLKNLTVDCSYAHAFFRNQSIHIQTAQNSITGINQGQHDAVSLKLTFLA